MLYGYKDMSVSQAYSVWGIIMSVLYSLYPQSKLKIFMFLRRCAFKE